jgi:hypothetical protein
LGIDGIAHVILTTIGRGKGRGDAGAGGRGGEGTGVVAMRGAGEKGSREAVRLAGRGVLVFSIDLLCRGSYDGIVQYLVEKGPE